MTRIEMNDYLEFWTADEVCECLSLQRHMPNGISRESTDRKLWGFVTASTGIGPDMFPVNLQKNRTPIGGDGSNGTVETPCGRLSAANDDKAPHWWDLLEDYEKIAINKAIKDCYCE